MFVIVENIMKIVKDVNNLENKKSIYHTQGISSNVSKSLSNATPPTTARLAGPFMPLVGTRQPRMLQGHIQPASTILISNVKLLKKLTSNINNATLSSQRLLNLPDAFHIATHLSNEHPEIIQIKKYLYDLHSVMDKFQALSPEMQKIILSQFKQTSDNDDETPSYSPLTNEERAYINSIENSNPDLLSPNMLSAIANELVLLSAIPMPDETKAILTSISLFVALLSILLYRKSL